MAVCPSCKAQIEISSEFFGGLFTCPLCKAVYFIGFDGTPEGFTPPPPLTEPPANDFQPSNGFENYQQASPSFDQAGGGTDYQMPETPSLQVDSPQVSDQPQFDINAPLQPLDNDLSAGHSIPEDVPTSQPTGGGSLNPLQDVVDFANKEEAKSLATYTVTISGLDFSQNLQIFKEVLLDSKLDIHYDQIRSKIKNGTIRLEKLDPSQAAVLAFRLRPYPIGMKWEQVFI